MLVIRFLRKGKKNQPFFRIVVTDKRNPPQGGRFLEILGFYNPLTKEKKVKTERVKHWLSVGAKPSDTVYNLLISEGVIKAKKLPVHSKAKKKKKEPASTEATKGKEEPKVKSAAPEGSEPRPENSGREEKPVEKKPKEPASAEATAGREKP
ncbi:30S ribosomal protein S16 [Candidatus Parcubacteria bacterium]|nr:30S ribosomal protein S16 [Candidatus Parcubacteria bacterium]